uniref:RRM domain-containing protein n=1 Tax=Arcella intermedia TaxID=1963864 RepID=A0A6B2LIH3_9EUKA
MYLKNFGEDMTEERLRRYFTREGYGEIVSVKIMRDGQGNSKGFGFISFGTPQGAAMALKEMDGYPLPGSRKPLYVTYHEPKALHQRKLALRFSQQPPKPSRHPPSNAPTIQTEWGEVALTMGVLSKYEEVVQRNIVAEKLYSIIERTEPEFVGQITDMFLEERGIEDLLGLLYDENKLNKQVIAYVGWLVTKEIVLPDY